MLDYKTKQLSLKERIECNDITTEMNPRTGTVIVRDMFAQRIKYLRFGLKTIDGIDITSDNFDEQILKLTNNDIEEISGRIADETNFPKKK